MHTRDSFQSSVSESEKGALLPRPSLFSLDLEGFSLFSCLAASRVLRLRNHKSIIVLYSGTRGTGSGSPFWSLFAHRGTGGHENAGSYLEGQFIQLLRDTRKGVHEIRVSFLLKKTVH